MNFQGQALHGQNMLTSGYANKKLAASMGLNNSENLEPLIGPNGSLISLNSSLICLNATFYTEYSADIEG